MRESSEKYLKQLSEESLKAADKWKKLQEVLAIFPDVEVHFDRWQNMRLGVVDANPQVDQVEIRHGCGCCNDSPLFVYPYTTLTNGERVHSEPHQFCVGEQNAYGYGEREYPGWEEKMREVGINEVAIKQVREYLDAHPGGSFEDDDEDSD